MAPHPNQKRTRDRILAVFLLGASSLAAFAEAIYDARVNVLNDAYTAAVEDLGIDIGEWEVPDSLLKQMATESKANAQSIVDTYNESITRESEQFAAHYQGDDLAGALKQDLTTWTKARADWKASQVASYETGRGYSAGIETLISDLQAEDVPLPDGMSLSDLVITVEPPDAGESRCAALIEGNPYTLDNADEVAGILPLHPQCIHYLSLSIA